MESTESLKERLEADIPSGLLKEPQYYIAGDYLTYFDSDEECYAFRVNDLLTIYTGIGSGKLVGCKIKGVMAVLRKVRGMKIEIHAEEISMAFLFLQIGFETKGPEEQRQLSEVAARFGGAPVPSELTSCA